MTKRLLLDSLCGQKRLAVIENGKLCEMHYERGKAEGISGNIYTGSVKNVLPGMNAAFVDIGLDKNAFLYAGDIGFDTRGDKALAGKLESLSIRDMVRPGQEIMVQVVKEPGGTKGPRISSHITLPGRMLVLLPTLRYIGISRRIENEGERARLRSIASKLLDEHGMGVIMRTASEGADEDALAAEYQELVCVWNDVANRGRTVKAPALIYDGGSLERTAVRDIASADDEIITDDARVFSRLQAEAGVYAPDMLQHISMHGSEIPLFDVYGIEAEYEKALRHHVWLDCGGYLVIDHTEALTVIDVNTGKHTGRRDIEETILQTNLQAAVETARQLRLRDIGGIIIVDFIDMKHDEDREELLEVLRREMRADRTPSAVVGMTALGLVELTRKKQRLSAQKLLKHVCPQCGGEGVVDDFEAVARRIAYDLRRRRARNPGQAFIVNVSSGVAGALIAVGAPKNMTVHVEIKDMPDCEYTIEPVDKSAISRSMKLLATEK